MFVETYRTRISAVKIPVKFDVKFTTGISTFKIIKVAFVTKLTPVPPKKEDGFPAGRRFSVWRQGLAKLEDIKVTKVSVHRLFSCSFQS